MSLRIKLLLCFVFMIFMMIIVGVIGFGTLRKVIGNYSHVTDINLENLLLINQMSHHIQEGQMLSELVFITKDEQRATQYINDVKSVISEFAEVDKKYQSVPFTEGEEELYVPMVSAWKVWVEKFEKLENKFKSGEHNSDREGFRAFVLDELLVAHESIEGKLSKLITYHQDQSRHHGSYQRV